ncbi:MAG: ABC transporter ATP-binding protein [Ruminococcaceae bacterium]|nr:ABC transporter ATP-binding protein [Oscillospiraceae bacterium]
MIQLHNVYAGYSGRNVIHDISLTLQPGKVTVIIGPNGCGKSTLLKTITGILPLSDGQLLFNGVSSAALSPTQTARQVAYLPQSRRVPDISVLSLVLHGRFPYLSYPRRYQPEDRDIARRALDWVGLKELEKKNVKELSGGMQQGVYLAMALAQDTNTILMDEPTTFLDIAHQLHTMELARRLAAEGKAVVMVLHDLSLALRTADTLAVMEQGRLLCIGTPDELFAGGMLTDVFGVQVQRILSDDGWHYVCSALR